MDSDKKRRLVLLRVSVEFGVGTKSSPHVVCQHAPALQTSAQEFFPHLFRRLSKDWLISSSEQVNERHSFAFTLSDILWDKFSSDQKIRRSSSDRISSSHLLTGQFNCKLRRRQFYSLQLDKTQHPLRFNPPRISISVGW